MESLDFQTGIRFAARHFTSHSGSRASSVARGEFASSLARPKKPATNPSSPHWKRLLRESEPAFSEPITFDGVGIRSSHMQNIMRYVNGQKLSYPKEVFRKPRVANKGFLLEEIEN